MSQGYERHLQYHDAVVGQLIAHLKAAGKFDRALLIVTSDHSWRGDPLEPSENWKIDPIMRRVPLLIKLPNEQAARIVDKTVYNNLHLGPIVEAILRGDTLTEDDGVALFNQLEEVPTPTGKNSVRPVRTTRSADDGASHE